MTGFLLLLLGFIAGEIIGATITESHTEEKLKEAAERRQFTKVNKTWFRVEKEK